jgi:hypothetical protein
VVKWVQVQVTLKTNNGSVQTANLPMTALARRSSAKDTAPLEALEEDKGNKVSSRRHACGGGHKSCFDIERAGVYISSYYVLLSTCHMTCQRASFSLSLFHALELAPKL